jgi:hypothetical protein
MSPMAEMLTETGPIRSVIEDTRQDNLSRHMSSCVLGVRFRPCRRWPPCDVNEVCGGQC